MRGFPSVPPVRAGRAARASGFVEAHRGGSSACFSDHRRSVHLFAIVTWCVALGVSAALRRRERHQRGRTRPRPRRSRAAPSLRTLMISVYRARVAPEQSQRDSLSRAAPRTQRRATQRFSVVAARGQTTRSENQRGQRAPRRGTLPSAGPTLPRCRRQQPQSNVGAVGERRALQVFRTLSAAVSRAILHVDVDASSALTAPVR